MSTTFLAGYRLRPGLEIIRLDPKRFMVFDPATRKHIEFGPDERYLLYLVGRCESLEDVLERYRERFGKSLDRQQLLGFLEQFRRLGLTADGAPAGGPGPVSPGRARRSPTSPSPRSPNRYSIFVSIC